MGALPKALARRGHRVMVVAPRYGEYAEGWETGVRRQMRVFGGDQQVNTLSFPKPQTSTQLYHLLRTYLAAILCRIEFGGGDKK